VARAAWWQTAQIKIEMARVMEAADEVRADCSRRECAAVEREKDARAAQTAAELVPLPPWEPETTRPRARPAALRLNSRRWPQAQAKAENCALRASVTAGLDEELRAGVEEARRGAGALRAALAEAEQRERQAAAEAAETQRRLREAQRCAAEEVAQARGEAADAVGRAAAARRAEFVAREWCPHALAPAPRAPRPARRQSRSPTKPTRIVSNSFK